MEKQRLAPVSQKQKVILVEFVQNHPNLETGKFSSEFTFKKAQGLWQEITDILNSIGPTRKEWKQWRKVNSNKNLTSAYILCL